MSENVQTQVCYFALLSVLAEDGGQEVDEVGEGQLHRGYFTVLGMHFGEK
jgi:hypothetical protein